MANSRENWLLWQNGQAGHAASGLYRLITGLIFVCSQFVFFTRLQQAASRRDLAFGITETE